MSLAIEGRTQIGQLPGGNGRNIQWGQFAFNGTDLTGSLPVSMRLVESLFIDPIRAAGEGITDQQVVPTISATTTVLLRALRGGTVTGIDFTTPTTVAADAANIWTVGVINKGAAAAGTAVVVDAATAANSNNSTGGTAFTNFTPRLLTLSGVAADKVVVAGDVLAFTFTKASSAANIVLPTIRVTIGNDDKVEWVDAPSQGVLSVPTSGNLAVARKGLNVTSGLKCAYFAIGM